MNGTGDIVSIVIVSYNTKDITTECIESIRAYSDRNAYEIIVVDNNSSDGSAEHIERMFPDVRLIRNDANVGFAAGQNIGLLEARGSILGVTNSDILFVEDTIARIVSHFSRQPSDIAALGPRIMNRDGSLAPSARRAFASRTMIACSVFNRHFNYARFVPQSFLRSTLGFLLRRWHDNFDSHDTDREVEFVDGMCVFFRRSALASSGLFDEQFFFDAEIGDLCNRIRSQGGRLLFFPGTTVIHLGHTSRRKVRPIIIETHKSELRYYAKHRPDMVPYLKLVSGLVSRGKRSVLKLMRSFSPAPEVSESIEIYDRLIDVIDSFDASEVIKQERIPRLVMRTE